ncbi:MAG: lysophospholipase, partial [Lentisphaeria bacterium]|nr:lysophospholipase [Lentisphaeria bacterium]
HRAWPAMLKIALESVYPKARIEMTNAGRSGHTTAAGLKRIERDVLSKKPHLVVVMFGMNDLAYDAKGKTPERIEAIRKQYQRNLGSIIDQCRGVGAEVLLCTPNPIYPEGVPKRPVERIAEYADAMREVAREKGVPVADGYAAFEQLRAKDQRAWMLCMSETIHPSMAGHKLYAETMAEAIEGKPVSLKHAGPIEPGLPHVRTLLAARKPIRLVAPQPYADTVAEVLRKLGAPDVQITPWPTEGQTLLAMQVWAQKHVRAAKPDLVLVAVPDSALAAGYDDEKLIRAYSWIVNWSLYFGRSQWDVVGVLPSISTLEKRAGQAVQNDTLARGLILGHDVPVIERLAGDQSPAPQILEQWFQEQLRTR